jgi:hypothetical protein
MSKELKAKLLSRMEELQHLLQTKQNINLAGLLQRCNMPAIGTRANERETLAVNSVRRACDDAERCIELR